MKEKIKELKIKELQLSTLGLILKSFNVLIASSGYAIVYYEDVEPDSSYQVMRRVSSIGSKVESWYSIEALPSLDSAIYFLAGIQDYQDFIAEREDIFLSTQLQISFTRSYSNLVISEDNKVISMT